MWARKKLCNSFRRAIFTSKQTHFDPGDDIVIGAEYCYTHTALTANVYDRVHLAGRPVVVLECLMFCFMSLCPLNYFWRKEYSCITGVLHAAFYEKIYIHFAIVLKNGNVLRSQKDVRLKILLKETTTVSGIKQPQPFSFGSAKRNVAK